MSTEDAEFERLAEKAIRKLTMEPDCLRAVSGVIQDVEEVLRTRWPDCFVKPFGSVINGTATRDSDLDLTVMFEDGTDASEGNAELAYLAGETLKQHPLTFTHVDVPDKFFITATCVHISSGIPVDISFRRAMNVQNTALVKYLMNLDRRAFQLTMLVKRWAALRGVKVRHRDHEKGQALTNYNIVLLVIFYLQQRRVLPPVGWLQRGAQPLYIEGWNAAFEAREFHTDNRESLLSLVGGIFEYYVHFEYKRYAISVLAGCGVERRALKHLPDLPLPPELCAYRTHPPVDTKPAFLMLECFDYNRRSGTVLNLEQFQIAADAYRHLNSNEFFYFLLTI